MNDFKLAGKSVEDSSDLPSQQPSHKDVELRHRNVGSGGARAAVFGISDGLATNISPAVGVTAEHSAFEVVLGGGAA